MNQNEIRNAQKQIYELIEIYLNKYLTNNGNCTYSEFGVITVKNDNLYNVRINGQEYTNIPCQTGLNFNVDDRVEVQFINGNSKYMKVVDIMHW